MPTRENEEYTSGDKLLYDPITSFWKRKCEKCHRWFIPNQEHPIFDEYCLKCRKKICKQKSTVTNNPITVKSANFKATSQLYNISKKSTQHTQSGCGCFIISLIILIALGLCIYYVIQINKSDNITSETNTPLTTTTNIVDKSELTTIIIPEPSKTYEGEIIYKKMSDQTYLAIYPDGHSIIIPANKLPRAIITSVLTSTITPITPPTIITIPTIITTKTTTTNTDNNTSVENYAIIFNEYRQSKGCSPLIFTNDLNKIAQLRLLEIKVNYNHNSIGGYNKHLAENIIKGSYSNVVSLKCWENSSGHNANMLNNSYKNTGYAAGNGYAVQVFSSYDTINGEPQLPPGWYFDD